MFFFFLHHPDLVHPGEWPLCCCFFSYLFIYFWMKPIFENHNKREEAKNCSIRLDDNHRLAAPVKTYFHLVHYLLSLWSTHDFPPLPFFFHSHCLAASLSFSFPLVLSAVIIPLFFEVSINSSPSKTVPKHMSTWSF